MSGRHFLVVGSAPLQGAEPAYLAIIADADTVIAADGGVELCLRADRVPDLLVGDFDSVSPSTLARARELGVRVVTFPAEKDDSDLDLALAVARSEGATRITYTAAFTGRMDHTLASLGTLARSADLAGEAHEPGWRAYALDSLVRDRIELREAPGIVLSLMACTGPAVVSISGVRYPLTRHGLAPLSSLGLSNIAVDEVQKIEVHEGAVLVLVNSGVS